MTTEEKNKIIDLKNKGYGYKKISTELNISIGSIRNVLKVSLKLNTCLHCGRKLTFVPGKKKKRFCCNQCRYRYWNSQKKAGNTYGL